MVDGECLYTISQNTAGRLEIYNRSNVLWILRDLYRVTGGKEQVLRKNPAQYTGRYPTPKNPRAGWLGGCVSENRSL